ncbi:MAG: hypothetical protein MJZ33_13785 [Paludibacteraceae bacterium]|nr:hypothetical protein [Paludibacteraceae bacterium]
MNRLGYLSFIFIVYSQLAFPQDDMSENLRRKTLSEYVTSCGNNEEQALLKLLQYEMPKKISSDYRWYTICDLDQDHCLATRASYESLSYFGSLQLKAFSWIIRIYNGDYDECPFYYDFGYDYEKSKRKGILKRSITNKEFALDNYIKEWFENNNWYLFLHEREYAKAPIRIRNYSIIQNRKR